MSVRRRRTVESSAREANFACKQKSHYGEEDGEDKQHIRRAHHRVVGQLVRLASHLVDIEAYGEDERRHAEQDHWREGAREEMLVYGHLLVIPMSSCCLTQKRQMYFRLIRLNTFTKVSVLTNGRT